MRMNWSVDVGTETTSAVFDAAPNGDRSTVFVCAHGAGGHMADKGMLTVTRALGARGLDIVVIGGPQEASLAQAIQREVPRARDLTGRTDFARIAVLGAKAALAVGNDTGPLHLAAAAGAPTVVLFSNASDPALSAPRGKVAVLRARRLSDLPVAQVAQAAASLL